MYFLISILILNNQKNYPELIERFNSSHDKGIKVIEDLPKGRISNLLNKLNDKIKYVTRIISVYDILGEGSLTGFFKLMINFFINNS